jgi:hypothetical protein
MEYRVGVDTPDKTMHTTWFKPSGTGGIPTAWIIDQKGSGRVDRHRISQDRRADR